MPTSENHARTSGTSARTNETSARSNETSARTTETSARTIATKTSVYVNNICQHFGKPDNGTIAEIGKHIPHNDELGTRDKGKDSEHDARPGCFGQGQAPWPGSGDQRRTMEESTMHDAQSSTNLIGGARRTTYDEHAASETLVRERF